jgi:hypothetical protein
MHQVSAREAIVKALLTVAEALHAFMNQLEYLKPGCEEQSGGWTEL